MLKRILVITVLLLFAFQSTAFAFGTEGDVVFTDALYGAAIGAMLGAAFYLVDDDDFARKIGVGVILGTAGGVAFGLAKDTRSVVEIQKDGVKLAVPSVTIQKRKEDILYTTSLLKVEF
jgi:hypothetical protein